MVVAARRFFFLLRLNQTRSRARNLDDDRLHRPLADEFAATDEKALSDFVHVEAAAVARQRHRVLVQAADEIVPQGSPSSHLCHRARLHLLRPCVRPQRCRSQSRRALVSRCLDWTSLRRRGRRQPIPGLRGLPQSRPRPPAVRKKVIPAPNGTPDRTAPSAPVMAEDVAAE